MNDEAVGNRPILYRYFDKTARQLLAQYERSKLQESSSSIGDNRERFVDQFLTKVLPPRLRVKQRAQVWDSQGTTTGELDIVLLRDDAPSLEFGGERDILLAEGVYAVIEVKSNLTRGKMREALSTLKRVQSLSAPSAQRILWAGPQMDRPLRCVFAYEGAAWNTLLDELCQADNPGVVDSVSVLDRGILLSNTLVSELQEGEATIPYAVVEGRAASLGFLYFVLVSFATTFMARVLTIADYFAPAEGWYD